VEIWELEGPWVGKLAVCSRPRSGWFLEDDLRALRAAGYGVLISALTPEEVIAGQLERVPELSVHAGIEFHHFPVGNLQVAPFERAQPRVEEWHDRLESGEGIAVHCWGTVGRGPSLAAALLIRGGLDPVETWRRITIARGRDVPDTLEQQRWSARFARGLEE
jgi:protein-tyrosine phosphatase